MNRMLARWFVLIFPTLFAAAAWAQAPASRVEETAARSSSKAPAVAPVPQQLFGSIQLSTRSAEARSLVELAWDKYENAIYYDAVEIAQRAAKKDPQSAVAFAMTSFAARRTTPDLAALAKAQSLLPQASPDEQLLVRWMTGIQDRDLLPAITSMNDLLKRFPNDKHILYVTAEWLFLQQDFDRAQSMMESALKLDPNFPAALNRLGYVYISTTHPDPDKALASLRHYAEVQPTSPNPQDSLGEISRIVGDDRASLQHYSAALKIDPTFLNSQVSLGDTRTLMGDFTGARKEYDRALLMTNAPLDQYWIKLQRALVPFWEGHSEEGRKNLAALAEEADRKKEPNSQFQIAMARAMLAADPQSELQQLQSLSTLLDQPLPGMSEADRGLNRAIVLRERARVAASSNRPDEAQRMISLLEELATASRDLVIQDCYESARGYLLFSQGDFVNAADELAADPRSPLAVQLLAVAQEKLGNANSAQEVRARLKYLRAPNVEWYLVSRHNASVAN
ncbi:MAG TPA: tetratricopeptide repeat protein [Candidatus Angelobacter sp.]|nr:tetratricopeptide repeat protein [Candidatus Angelobacter sp.]